jgi:hypothetical protein
MIDMSLHNYVLYRVEDGKSIPVKEIGYMINGDVDSIPLVGSSIVGDPHDGKCSWITTPIVEIISNSEFKTDGSTYKIYEL